MSQTSHPLLTPERQLSVSETNVRAVSQEHPMETPPARDNDEYSGSVGESDPLMRPKKADAVISGLKRLVRETSLCLPDIIAAQLPYKTKNDVYQTFVKNFNVLHSNSTDNDTPATFATFTSA